MNSKTMEGLVGARSNMELLNTPFRVYKEARRKGDTGTMERAMGYVNECSDKAEEYRVKAEKGMEEDAKEAREKAESDRESNIRKRKEEREELEKRIEEKRNKNKDTVEISEDGRAVRNENADQEHVDGNNGMDAEAAAASQMKPVIYTKTGEAGQSRSESGLSLSVSV